ncbi:hypothetical protein FHX74_001710 [Friedmanniella endophytica]|uniref:Uncharacterized protein n=1 Tax=Microlunatus kandeliicorticis TaxID=1759536 RepID=A0A7W3IRY7_9ACTN|nr:hypothetical protein [Microlunatus kandeliicorticis]MBA8794105.1 hypothetical protein [Microlunatus kandeliicorticis]
MSGASDRTRRVSFVNGNWTPGTSPHFELLIVTEDEERHSQAVPVDQVAGVMALVQAAGVLLWDPEGPTLIAANVVGEWLPATFSTLDAPD